MLQVVSSLMVGGDVHVTSLCTVTVQRLAALMDPPHPRGSDWWVHSVEWSFYWLTVAIHT